MEAAGEVLNDTCPLPDRYHLYYYATS
jgi:hypothetical protein